MFLSSIKSFFTFTLVAVVLSGCASKNPRPTPSSTLPDGASENAKDWNVPTNGAYQDDINGINGLKERGANIPGGGRSGAGVSRGPNPNSIASVYFGFDQSAIAAGERAKLQTVASRMQTDPNLRVVVEGHCDARGTAEYNLALGERRAKSVVQYLVTSFKISQNCFETLSKGDLEASEGSASEMAADRRADIVPLK